jgi:hypothetical protein
MKPASRMGTPKIKMANPIATRRTFGLIESASMGAATVDFKFIAPLFAVR